MNNKPVNESAPTWTYGFWESLTADEYARRQGVEAVRDLSRLQGTWDPGDWDGFDETLERWHTDLQPA